MIRRTIVPAVMAGVVASTSLASARAPVVSRNARVDGKHADKVLFEQAQKAMEKSNYPEARIRLEKLINDHPGRTMCLVQSFP